jgi:hypothetical protein
VRNYWEQLDTLPSLSAVREKAEKMPRWLLLQMLQWNDPSGSWLDYLNKGQGVTPATKKEAVDAVVTVIDQAAWAMDDPRRGK